MIGPQTAFSQHLHGVKYRTDGESFDDYCVRYARTLADDEHHFRHLLGGLREQRILPGGRQQLAIGRPFQTTAFSCFRGDTEILTEKGFRCFADMEGEEVGVLSPVSGVFERATIRHYGDQTLNRIILSSTFRDQGETFEVYATENHRWVLQGGSVVDDLMVGDLLQAGTSSVEIDDRGWVHGFVCGDGSACDAPHTYQAFLYGPKGNHLARIKESGVEVVSVTKPPSMYERQPELGGVPLVRLRSRINLKELPPPDATPAYLRGFVHGLLAADGCHKTAPPVFNNTKWHLVEWMRDHMILAGYAPVGGLKVETKPSNIDRASGREERISPLYRVLFRPVSGEGGHYGCRVLAIDRAVSHETVYCADEPKHHQLTLRRGLRTGNCYVGGVIPDSMAGIMDELKDSALTLRAGGGCGWNFSTLRPELDPIRGLGPGARASGPVGFMPLWHTMCATIMSAGMRRGAMMGVLDVTHPDILKFIRAKRTPGALTNFNVSVNCTDAFMEAVEHDGLYELKFDGQTYQRVRALDVWATIMESNWDWAEPGVLFLDRTNRMNPLAYCETIFSTNPSMPAGTKVHTSRGILPIESLEGQTFKVKSMDGVWASAKCFLSGEDEPILEIDYGGGRSVRCTPQHSWPVLLNGRYVKVRADELVPGDLIPTNRNEPLGHDSDSPLGYQDGLVTGLWFGNGCAGERTDDGRAYLGFSFNRQDTELAEAVATYFGITVSEREAEFSLQVSRDGAARQFMTTVGADLSDPKGKLPAAVWTAGDDFVRGFVSGLFSADGWVGCRPPNTKIVFTNRSADVCREVAVLLGFHGVTSLLRESVAKLNGKEYPRADLHISHNGAKRFARVFRLDSRRKQSSLETLVGIECRAHVGADHLRVEAVRPAGRAKVWDISVQHRQHVFPTEYTYTGNCGEQPLPPHGACLLGSLNVVKYLVPSYARGLHPFGDNGDPRRNGHSRYVRGYELNLDLFREDARAMVRAFDNVIENTVYPLPRQQQEARDKRRMGCGVTGMANALEVCGFPYGTSEYLEAQDRVLTLLRDTAYETSVELAREKGSFPLFDAEKWLASGFAQTLPEDIRGKIRKHGLRNGLLLSLAPTGTLSLTADNVSSCIEPPPFLETERLVNLEGGQTSVTLRDYALENYGVRGRTAGECSPAEHVAVLCAAQKYVDSSISKTINCAGARGGEPQPGEITFAEFKEVYWQAWQGGAKGCTTYNMNGKRAGIMQEKKPARRPSSSAAEAAGDGDTVVDEIPAFRQGAENCPLPEGGSACFVDPTTGTRTCDS